MVEQLPYRTLSEELALTKDILKALPNDHPVAARMRVAVVLLESASDWASMHYLSIWQAALDPSKENLARPDRIFRVADLFEGLAKKFIK